MRVGDILDAIAKIEQYVRGLTFEQFTADQKTVDAVVRNLEVIGEAVRRLSNESESDNAYIALFDHAIDDRNRRRVSSGAATDHSEFRSISRIGAPHRRGDSMAIGRR